VTALIGVANDKITDETTDKSGIRICFSGPSNNLAIYYFGHHFS
jgi:hypothetical protein